VGCCFCCQGVGYEGSSPRRRDGPAPGRLAAWCFYIPPIDRDGRLGPWFGFVARHELNLFRLLGPSVAVGPQMALARSGPLPRGAVRAIVQARPAPALHSPGRWANALLSACPVEAAAASCPRPSEAGSPQRWRHQTLLEQRSSANGPAQATATTCRCHPGRPWVYEPLKSTGALRPWAAGAGANNWQRLAEGESGLVGAGRAAEGQPGRLSCFFAPDRASTAGMPLNYHQKAGTDQRPSDPRHDHRLG